jgi:hypothetical protein
VRLSISAFVRLSVSTFMRLSVSARHRLLFIRASGLSTVIIFCHGHAFVPSAIHWAASIPTLLITLNISLPL